MIELIREELEIRLAELHRQHFHASAGLDAKECARLEQRIKTIEFILKQNENTKASH